MVTGVVFKGKSGWRLLIRQGEDVSRMGKFVILREERASWSGVSSVDVSGMCIESGSWEYMYPYV